MPTNLYGPNDNYDLNNSHVLPALIRKFHSAKVNGAAEVEIWGSGTPRREFLHVDDLADACYYLLQNYDGEQLVNVGSGVDVTILELANLVKEIVGFTGTIKMDATKPDGTPRKLMDVSKLEKVGWKYSISLQEGIASVYKEVLERKVFDN
jgi:GDP-L-fucose synthase